MYTLIDFDKTTKNGIIIVLYSKRGEKMQKKILRGLRNFLRICQSFVIKFPKTVADCALAITNWLSVHGIAVMRKASNKCKKNWQKVAVRYIVGGPILLVMYLCLAVAKALLYLSKFLDWVCGVES